MTTAAPEPKANMGQPIPRYDAVAKVTGTAEYAADVPLARPAYAYLITSAIAKGRNRCHRHGRREEDPRRHRHCHSRECREAEGRKAVQQRRPCLDHQPATEVS